VNEGAYQGRDRLPMPRRRLRLGLVGGGRGAFFGRVHATAARHDDRFELVAGALSSDPERARASAADYFIAPERAYGNYQEMAAREAARPDGIDVVAVVTPNHTHHAIAGTFVDHGIDVMCEKPMTTELADALDLVRRVRTAGVVFGVVYTFAGYPMVRQARAMVAAGEIGTVRLVDVEILQDWLATAREADDAQAAWRTDPERAGPGGALGDIAVHAYHLACYVIGEAEAALLSAQLSTFVPGRRLDDDAQLQLRFPGGARGRIWASQVAPGNELGLRIRVYGDGGGLEWALQTPNYLRHTPLGEHPRTLGRGAPDLHPSAHRASRIPVGHPEGHFDALANLYAELALAVEVRRDGRDLAGLILDLPGVEDGARGVRLIETSIESSRQDGRWLGAGLALQGVP
jgi:predicted dehydrogenase